MQEKLNCAKALIDIYFDIKNADEQLFSYLARGSYNSLLSFVYEDDRDKLRNLLLNCGEEQSCVIRLIRKDNTCRECLFICRKSKFKQLNNQLYEIELTDICDLYDSYNKRVLEADFFAELLGMNKELFYVFNYETQLLTVFGIVNGLKNKNYECSMERLLMNLNQDNTIDAATIKKVEDWFESINSKCLDTVFEFPKGIGSEFVLSFPCCLSGGYRVVCGKEFFVGSIGEYTESDIADNNRMITAGITDPLTGLLNKREIAKIAQRSIEKNSLAVALFILDIDDFKNINDTYGHMFGDRVIVRVADVIAKSVGNNGYVGRIGGDEFMGVIEAIPNVDDLRPILRSIRSNIEYLFKDEIENISISCSMGVVRNSDVTGGYEDMFRYADKCLYLAKQKGKNRYIIYIPDIHGTIDKHSVENIIKVSDNEKRTSLSSLMTDIILQLHSGGIESIEQILEKTAYAFSLDRIVIYWGEHMKRVASYEMIETLEKVFPFADDEYNALFDENGVLTTKYTRFVVSNEKIALFYKNRHTVKFIQKKIVRDGKIRGIISYEICHKTSKLSDEIKDCLIILAEIMGQICYENEDRL